MPNYVVYDSDTGDIIKRGHCPKSDIDLQAKPGQSVMIPSDSDPVACDETCKIENGRVRESTTKKRAMTKRENSRRQDHLQATESKRAALAKLEQLKEDGGSTELRELAEAVLLLTRR